MLFSLMTKCSWHVDIKYSVVIDVKYVKSGHIRLIARGTVEECQELPKEVRGTGTAENEFGTFWVSQNTAGGRII